MTMRNEGSFLARYSADLGIWVLLLGCLAFGYSLDRYPGFYVDDVVFAYPALQAAHGGALAYPGSTGAPYVSTLWAYHGPLLPYLDILIFKLFGFSTVASRLPDFLGGWLAALLIVLFLKRRGYRYAGLAFAVLWCGDRAVQEIMYGRMDGLALLIVVVAFLFVEKAWQSRSAWAMFLCGVFCGLAILTHPLCSAFAAVAFGLIWYRAGWMGAARFTVGGLLTLPVLLAMWRFHPVEALTQFFWVAATQKKIMGVARALELLATLHMGRYWFFSLLVFATASSVWAAVLLWRRRDTLNETDSDVLLVSSFGFAALILLCRSTLYPYYVVYFSLWPMLGAVILAERHWRRFRLVASVMALAWCFSATWNVMRLREPLRNYAALSHRFLLDELKKNAPSDAKVVTTSELYAIPIEAGYKNRGLTTFAPEHQDICAACFVLITEAQFRLGEFIPRSNLDQRKVLYEGAAFPGAGPLEFPVVLLSPESAAGLSGLQ